MKSLKKFLLTTAMTMIVGTSAFAESGFEFLLNLSGGLGIPIPNKEAKDLELKGDIGFDVAVDAQIGYMFQVVDRFGISVLAELGYAFNGFGSYNNIDVNEGGVNINTHTSYTYSFHNFKLGLLPKFNIGLGGRHGLAIGIGGGVKIPLAANIETSTRVTIAGNEVTTEYKYKYNRQEITDFYSPSVVGYMKATFDYYLFFTDNIAMNFGLYLGGDFGMKQKETKIGYDFFDFGLQLGFRFGPKA